MAVLRCPRCGCTELATTEELSGAAWGEAVLKDGERAFIHEGWTEVWWDSSTTVGIECRSCGWSKKDKPGKPAIDRLVTKLP